MLSTKIKGVFLVALGATSYGMLATVVKLAYLDAEKFTTAEVSTAQFTYGILGVLLINLFQKLKSKTKTPVANTKNIFSLMLAGTSLGATSIFYYLCVKYLDVSIAIVLLMQSVWIGVVLEWILDKKPPSKQKIMAVFVVLIGTVLATNILFNSIKINVLGIFFGLLAATSFTATMFTANKVAITVSTAQRSLFMLLGGLIVILIFTISITSKPFNFSIFGKYGLFLALFGTIIPPMLLNTGFPKTGIGLGSIVSSLELPVSVLMAFFILNENVTFLQWLGIFLIIFAVIIMNISAKKKK